MGEKEWQRKRERRKRGPASTLVLYLSFFFLGCRCSSPRAPFHQPFASRHPRLHLSLTVTACQHMPTGRVVCSFSRFDHLTEMGDKTLLFRVTPALLGGSLDDMVYLFVWLSLAFIHAFLLFLISLYLSFSLSFSPFLEPFSFNRFLFSSSLLVWLPCVVSLFLMIFPSLTPSLLSLLSHG